MSLIALTRREMKFGLLDQSTTICLRNDFYNMSFIQYLLVAFLSGKMTNRSYNTFFSLLQKQTILGHTRDTSP